MVHRAWAALPRAEALLASRTPTTAVSVDEAHDTISAVFCDHHLAPLERREVNMNLRSVRDAGVGIELLDYGEAVRIHVGGGLENFHLVQIPLRGRATMEVGNALVQSSSRVATVPPLDREFTMRWDTGVPTLILYAERSRLRTVAEAMYGVDGERLQLGLHLHLDTVAGGDFLRALLDHHSVLERGSADGAYARRLSAELLLTRLLSAVDNSVTRSLGTWASVERVRVTPGDALVRRFEDRIEGGAAEGASVLEIAAQLGVPLRTLQSHVRAVRGTTPTALLREAQLRHAHTLLEAADPLRETVTGIAQRAGFTHLGRFSTEYRRRFAESPGDTLRR
ncbi:AraC family transcriptional regulator [Leucobacter luti]|uniref:AraC family transcriptional regulator n=1 Tax=Leucobacter luti TaxID=340320 RepID=UPI00104565E7|nr:AraC family transcriptional regulator [Leucobacter luti]MCW2288674.1 AraC-like DNA-binding protein [Leucobacter luti]TCK45171.1 AraC family transcriptional regulator [Leucobacter luti]